MTSATANQTSSIRVPTDIYMREPARTAEVIERYILWLSGARMLSNVRAELHLYRLAVSAPAWLQGLRERIFGSIVPSDVAEENDGRWLSRQTAREAISFFNDTADVLPEEPFIYGTYSGDLVAEFKGKHGTLTSIVSPTAVLLFAVLGDKQPIEVKITDLAEVRDEVKKLAKLLNTGRHGTVDAFK